MKIYSWISNEKGVRKTQGAQEELTIEIRVEHGGKSWRELTSSDATHIVCRYEDGVPVIRILPGKAHKVVSEKAE